ncbi:MAG TPA: hypothetical protein VMS75_03675 [Terriglobales bacterium]|nr:hypothetical protein [Terriglobales bacterium]
MVGKKAVRRAAFLIPVAFSIIAAASVWPGAIIASPLYPGQETARPAPGQVETPLVPPADFQAALKAAEAGLASKKGKAYEKKMNESAGPWLASELSRCATQVGGTAFGPFTLLVRIGRSGRAEEVLAWPETHVADCLRPKFAAAEYPKPPRYPWWGKFDIRIKVKAREEPEEEPPPDAQAAGGIPYSGDLGVKVAAPAGWVLDNKSGIPQGTHCVMYPQGSSWKKALEVMYVNVDKFPPDKTFEEFIFSDVARFKKEFLGIRVEELEPIALRSGGKAEVRGYSGGTYPSFECVAYAPYPSGAAIFVLTCRSREGLERTVPLFRNMVARSYPVKIRFEGKKAIVTLNGPPAPPAEPASDAGGPTAGPEAAASAYRVWRQSGYSHWSRFKPGAYVTFRYRMKSAHSSQEMLKTITLEDVSPDSVILEYREWPAASATGTDPGKVMPLQRSRFEFRAASAGFGADDLFGGQLSFNPVSVLRGAWQDITGQGVEDLDAKGVRLPTEWRRFEYGGLVDRTMITIWTSDAVPGAVAKMVRVLGGDDSFTEEFDVEDFRAAKAEPADLERLRAARKPVLVETTVKDYVLGRFHFTESLGDASRRLWKTVSAYPSSSEADWVDAMAGLSALSERFREALAQFEEDDRAAAAELGTAEAAKLRPLVEGTMRLVGLYEKLAVFLTDVLSRSAADSAESGFVTAATEEIRRIMAEIHAATEDITRESEKAEGLKVRFLLRPEKVAAAR